MSTGTGGAGGGAPAGTAEDRKAAVSMWVTLSSQVITATLAILAVEGAFVTYVVDKRLPGAVFYALITLSALSLIFSILSGGVGISRLTVAGSHGRWELREGSSNFGMQSLACLVGVSLFFLSIFLFSGGTKEDAQAKEVKVLQDKNLALESQVKDLSQQLNELRSKYEAKGAESKPPEGRAGPPASAVGPKAGKK
jgi:cell division protein FtsB